MFTPALTDYLRDLLARWAFTTDALTRPAAWYVALLDVNGDEITTTADANYARQAATFAVSATDGRLENDATVSFAAAGTGADYTVYGFAVYDAASAGTRLAQAELEFEKAVTEGQVTSFSAGDLIVGVD